MGNYCNGRSQMESLSLPAPPYSPSDPSTWIAASQKQPEGVNVPVGYNNFGLLKFGDDAVDVIYEHLGPHDLAMCGRVCREMRPHMYRLSERCVRRLRKLHMTCN